MDSLKLYQQPNTCSIHYHTSSIIINFLITFYDHVYKTMIWRLFEFSNLKRRGFPIIFRFFRYLCSILETGIIKKVEDLCPLLCESDECCWHLTGLATPSLKQIHNVALQKLLLFCHKGSLNFTTKCQTSYKKPLFGPKIRVLFQSLN